MLNRSTQRLVKWLFYHGHTVAHGKDMTGLSDKARELYLSTLAEVEQCLIDKHLCQQPET